MKSSLLTRLRRQAVTLLAGLTLAGGSLADTYEVKLPPELSSSPRMCDYAPCKDVMPGATSFSERKGQPPYVEAYADEAGQKKLIGYVMLSTDITDIPAYSGKPVVTLIGMDAAGKFAGVLAVTAGRGLRALAKDAQIGGTIAANGGQRQPAFARDHRHLAAARVVDIDDRRRALVQDGCDRRRSVAAFVRQVLDTGS